MRRRLKRVLVLIVGWFFILVGIAGLFLPILQGILCLIIGLMILSTEYVWAHHLLRKLKERFPRIGRASEQATEKAQKWIQWITRRAERGHSTSQDKGQPAQTTEVDDR